MISVEGIDRPGRGHRLLGHIASCYWTMMRRLAERLTRGERDDAGTLLILGAMAVVRRFAT